MKTDNLYIVRHIYCFTITNLELLTIRDFKLHNTHLFRPMFLSSLFSYSYFKIFNLEKRNLKETRQSIKTFVALTSIKTRICQLGSRTCQVNHFFQHVVGQGCVASLPANKIHNFMEWRSTRVTENCHPYAETSEVWSVHLLAVGVRLRSKHLAWFGQPVRSRIEEKLSLSLLEGEKRFLIQALFRPIRQQLRAREQSIEP